LHMNMYTIFLLVLIDFLLMAPFLLSILENINLIMIGSTSYLSSSTSLGIDPLIFFTYFSSPSPSFSPEWLPWKMIGIMSEYDLSSVRPSRSLAYLGYLIVKFLPPVSACFLEVLRRQARASF
jgi:hypothetical protein